MKAKDEVSSDSLLTKLGIQDLDVVLRTSRMRWFGHVERSTGWISEVCKLNVVAQKRSGRPSVVMLGIIHTCTALRYKPAFIATR